MTAQHFSEVVGTIQKTTGMSQNELGRILGTTGSSIRDWMKKGVPKSKAVRIANNLRVKFKELIG